MIDLFFEWVVNIIFINSIDNIPLIIMDPIKEVISRVLDPIKEVNSNSVLGPV